MTEIKAICVFCGSSNPADASFINAAMRVGELIAQEGLLLVYGSGKSGMMGAVAGGALKASGKVWGVTHEREASHAAQMDGLDRLEVLIDLPARKTRMIALADAFIILPGGIGTMDEFFEILAATQVGLQSKPIGILNTNGYFDGLLTWMERAVSERFLGKNDLELVIVESVPEKLLARLCYN